MMQSGPCTLEWHRTPYFASMQDSERKQRYLDKLKLLDNLGMLEGRR